jgi:5'-phosphate synthase pdxT subunit
VAGLGVLGAVAVRIAYGRQLDSSVKKLVDLDAAALGEQPLEAVFIRAPKLADLGAGVSVLARRDGDPVLVREGNVLAATFHPELGRDSRIHALFREMIAAKRRNGSAEGTRPSAAREAGG